MNPTHIHLVITHLPIFGTLMGALVLSYALWTKSNEIKVAAYLLFVISAIGAAIAYLTGESAEETVENLPGILEASIERHEDFALIALMSIMLLGLTSLVGIYFSWRKFGHSAMLAKIILLLCLISFGLFARTGYLGGQIRHTEINGAASSSLENESEYEQD